MFFGKSLLKNGFLVVNLQDFVCLQLRAGSERNHWNQEHIRRHQVQRTDAFLSYQAKQQL